MLAGYVLNLVLYPVSKGLWNDSQSASHALPTPFQLALILNLFSSSGWGSLYGWFNYLIKWRGRRQNQVRALTWSVLFTVLATFLG